MGILDDQVKKAGGVFKRLRPKDAKQARRFFYCDRAVKGSTCFLSGEACSKRHREAKKKIELMTRQGATEFEIEMTGAIPCGTCEFGAIRVELLKKRRERK